MHKFLQIGLVSLYIFLTGFCFLFLLALSGVYLSWPAFITALTGWGLCCFLSAYIRSPIHLFFHGRLRKPILEEEDRLQYCFQEVLQSAGRQEKFRLRIVEEKRMDAFATGKNIIAVSRSLLNELTDDELKGVMAHELGHLVSKDTLVSWAFITASDLPRMVKLVYSTIKRLLWKMLGIVLLILVLLFLFKPMLVLPIIAVILFVMLFSLLDRLFRLLRLVLSRRCEYKQDAYAHHLGYGAGLRNALKKFVRNGQEQVNAYSILMRGTHPVIYLRIRRLEQLLEWRV